MQIPGRNDPCHCGSGKKYKKCCAQLIAIAPASQISSNTASRSCGECTACCDGWLKGTIRGHEMYPGTPCHFVRNGSCSIYAERPEHPCRQFSCGWILPKSPFPDWFKPTMSGIIVIPVKWNGRPAYRLASAGRDASPRVLEWMMRFSHMTGQPFFYEQAGETMGFGPQAFLNDMQHRMAQGLPLW